MSSSLPFAKRIGVLASMNETLDAIIILCYIFTNIILIKQGLDTERRRMNLPRISSVFLLLILMVIGMTPIALFAAGGTVARLSVAPDGTQGNGPSILPSVSADGRYVAFQSDAYTLLPGTIAGMTAVYVHDRHTGAIERVALAPDGSQGNWSSNEPAISADGRYVAFSSIASNLVNGDTNQKADVFVRDRQLGVTSRVSVASDGTQGNENSFWVDISANGRYVVFMSEATTLVTGDTNASRDIFVHDRVTATTTRVSIASNGSQANNGSEFPKISDNGQVVVFRSNATNLVSSDTNGVTSDVFVHSLTTGATSLVSVATNGSQGNEASDWSEISGDGRYIAFRSRATNLVPGGTAFQRYHLYVRDQQAGTTTLESVSPTGAEGDSYTWGTDISADGTYLVLFSRATNLVSNDMNDAYDVFVRNRLLGTTTMVSVTPDGVQGDYGSGAGKIVGDATYVVFESGATNLVPGDTNNEVDIFLATVPGIPTSITMESITVAEQSNGQSLVMVVWGLLVGVGVFLHRRYR